MLIARKNCDFRFFAGECRTYFKRWDNAVRECDHRSARSIRREMLAYTRMQLSSDVSAEAGIYFFHRADQAIALSDVIYIGIAESRARPLLERLTDRLRDDHCFDDELECLSHDEALARIRMRMAVAMPRSKKDYATQHLTTRNFVRGSGQVLLNSVEADPQTIKETEKVLISTAWRLGAPLRNKKDLKFTKSVNVEAKTLAYEVVGAKPSPFKTDTIANWRDEIASHQARFE